MKWLAVLVLGLGAGFALGLVVAGPGEPPAASELPTAAEPGPAHGAVPTLDGAAGPAEREPAGAVAMDAPGADGLGIGHGLVLATGAVVSGAELATADLVILDIRERQAWLRTPHGSAGGALPIGAIGRPRTAGALAATFRDAPRELPDRSRVLEHGPLAPGIAFVRGAGDATWIVWIEHLAFDDDARRRRVRLGTRRVEAREGGGIARMPSAVDAPTVGISTRTLTQIAVRGRAVPRSMNRVVDRLKNDPKVVQDLVDGAELAQQPSPLVIPQALDGTLTIGSSAAAVAAKGTGPDARITTGFHGVLVILGDLDGKHDLKGHAHVHVTGDVLGEVRMENHAVLVVEGDVRGTVMQGSWTKLVLHGALRGRVTTDPDDKPTHMTLLLDRYVARAAMADLPKGGTWPKLYVRDSDLDEGKHENVGGWDEVHVGGAFWKTLGR